MLNKFSGDGVWTVIGLMSGTSLDGLDAARVRFVREAGTLADWQLLDYRQTPYADSLRADLEALIRGEPAAAATMARLHVELARAFADHIQAALPQAAGRPVADLIAFPGQTIWHDPEEAGVSWQIGSSAVLAALTGLPVVGDFRQPDLQWGGQGAPLVPLADALLHRDEGEYLALLNLGGIANLTLLPPGRGGEGVRAWDTGPGNTLLDLACRLAFDEPLDRDGARAARGSVDEDRLRRWLAQPWFVRPAPKSTGRELFGGQFLGAAAMKRELEALGPEDLLATLAELTVSAAALAIGDEPVERLFVAGGGARNRHLMARLAARLAPLPVQPMEALGLPAEAKEAVDFALLGLEAAAGRPVTLPAVTGATRAATAGVFCPPGPWVPECLND